VANGKGRLANAWTQPAGTACTGSQQTGFAPVAGQYLTLRSIAAYDAMGRIGNEQQYTPASLASGTPYSPVYQYDLAGNLLSSTSGGVGPTTTGTQTAVPFLFTNTYDSAGRLQTVGSNWTTNYATGTPNVFPATLFSAQSGQSQPCSNSSSATYSAFGGLMNATFGSGLTLNRAYDNRARTTCEMDKGIGTTPATPGSATVTITGAEQSQ